MSVWKKFCVLLTAAAILFAVTSIPAASFSDLPSSHWAYGSIIEMRDQGVLNGFEDGTFRPEQAVTRAEFATIVTKLFQLPPAGELPFSDIPPDSWYTDYVAAVSIYMPCYIDGSNGISFSPDKPLQRADAACAMVTMLGLVTEPVSVAVLDGLSDVAAMSDEEQHIVALAVKHGLMNGKDGYFDPRGNLTRAEICALLSRISRSERVPTILSEGSYYINQFHHPASGGAFYISFDPYHAVPSGDSLLSKAPVYEKKVLELVNQERAAQGLNPLAWADDLADVARAHSKDMEQRRFFDHMNPSGFSPFDRMENAGITYFMAAENIAAGQGTPAAVMESWMNSPGHRANILNPELKELGVGYVKAAEGAPYPCYWTQVFASR